MAPNQIPASSSHFQSSASFLFCWGSTAQDELEIKKATHPGPRSQTQEERMGAAFLQAVASLLTRLQRAAWRMTNGAGKGTPRAQAVVAPWKKTFSPSPSGTRMKTTTKEVEHGVWTKEILMGERCQPLNFSGAIYYDAEGRRLALPPPPRSPMRSPLPPSPRMAAARARPY